MLFGSTNIMTSRVLTISTLVALAQAKAIITNNCHGPVWIWSVPRIGVAGEANRPIYPGERYEEHWRRGTSETPGIALKLSIFPSGILDPSHEEVDFAYNIDPSDTSKVWVDLSLVRGKINTPNLSFHTCHGVYESLDFKTQQCHATDNIELVLCGSTRSLPAKDALDLDAILDCYDYAVNRESDYSKTASSRRATTKSQPSASSGCHLCVPAPATVAISTTVTTTAKPLTYEPYRRPPHYTSSSSYNMPPKFTSIAPYNAPSRHTSSQLYATPQKQTTTTTVVKYTTVTQPGQNHTVSYQLYSHSDHAAGYGVPPKHSTLATSTSQKYTSSAQYQQPKYASVTHGKPPKYTSEEQYQPPKHTTQPAYSSPPKQMSTKAYDPPHTPRPYAQPPQHTSSSANNYAEPHHHSNEHTYAPPKHTSSPVNGYAAPPHPNEHTYANPQHTSSSVNKYATPSHHSDEHTYAHPHESQLSSQYSLYASTSAKGYSVPGHHTEEYVRPAPYATQPSSQVYGYHTSTSVTDFSAAVRPSHTEPIDRPERPTEGPMDNEIPHAPEHVSRRGAVDDNKLKSYYYCWGRVENLTPYKHARIVNKTGIAPRTMATVALKMGSRQEATKHLLAPSLAAINSTDVA